MFLYQKTDLLCIFNIVKNMVYDFVRCMSKMMIQGFKVQMSYCKTHRIRNIMLKNASLHNLDIIPKVKNSHLDSIIRLILKSRTTFIIFYFQFRLKNLFSGKKTYLYVSQTSFSLYLHNQWTDFHKLSCAGKPQMRAICICVGCTKVTTND